MQNSLITAVEESQKRAEPLGDFEIGDTVDVHCRIKEGDKERIQIFTGTVIRERQGHGGVSGSFTVRRIVDGGFAVERVFPTVSPKIEKVVATRKGKVRRAKLYYLRDRVGKATKTKERIVSKAK